MSFTWPAGAILPRSSPEQRVDGTEPTPLFRLSEVYEEAYSRIGKELREAYQIIDASRSLRLLFTEWSNRGINLWAIVHESRPLAIGEREIDLPNDTADVLGVFIRENAATEDQMDYLVRRYSTDDWDRTPQKNMTDRPYRYWLDRSRRWPKMILWPIPGDDFYELFYTRMRTLRSPGAGLAGEVDAPDRMIPAICAGLAYLLALKDKDAMPLLPQLKAEYDRQWLLSQQDDREKSDLMIVPQDAWTL